MSEHAQQVRRFLFEASRAGEHVHVSVRAGTMQRMVSGSVGGTRALCGQLTFRAEEWDVLAALLRQGADSCEWYDYLDLPENAEATDWPDDVAQKLGASIDAEVEIVGP